MRRAPETTGRTALLTVLAVLLCACWGCVNSCSRDAQNDGAEPSGHAATPALSVEPIRADGLPNAYRVTEDLYRGAQPTAAGFRHLEEMGVKTVINLRALHSDRDELEGTSLDYVHIHMEAWDADMDELVRFLEVATDESRQPVFVHCQHGADRTGICCAVYRIAVCGWSKERAIQEMTRERFGFHEIWQNLMDRVEELDVRELERRAGLADGGSGGSTGSAPE